MSKSVQTTTATTRLLVLRHGQSEWNAQGRWQGQADIALTPEGVQQARQAALKLGAFDLIATSSLKRALHTAEIIAEHKKIVDLHIDDRLKESHIGPWQGLTYEEIEAGWPGFLESRRQPEDFEPNRQRNNSLVGATSRTIRMECSRSVARPSRHRTNIRGHSASPTSSVKTWCF